MTVLTNGTIYYASQTVSGVESTTRLAVTATIVNGMSNLVIAQAITSGTVVQIANTIEATNQISGADVTYRATQSVTLNPGCGYGKYFQGLYRGL